MPARPTTSTTAVASLASLILIFASSLWADGNLRRENPEDQVKYGVDHWAESLGLHRAVVNVTGQADAIGVHIPWRRRDLEPEKKRIVVVDASTGEQLKNVLPVHIQREYGDLVFQPATVPGDYCIYYMPFEVQEGYGGYYGDYLPPESTAEAAWLDRHGLTEERLPQKPWKELPQAELLEIQARTEFDRFDPMEVVATKAEVEELLASHPGPFLLFPEDRRYPIRMPDELPLRWIKQGPSHQFEGVAQRNEYYAFQIGLFAARQPLEELAVECGELRSSTGGTISGDRLTCFNLGGSDWLGQPMKKSLSVAQGQVQPLWFGLDIARDVKPGQYEGALRIGAKNAPHQQVDLVLTISSEVVEDRGDSEPWRHGRLRWLNSTIGIDNEVTDPYTALEVDGRTVRCLGRSVRFAETGLPESIRGGERQLLAAPVQIVVETDQGPHAASEARSTLQQLGPGRVVCRSDSRAGPVSLDCQVAMEFDGHVKFEVTGTADRDIELKDIRLEIPMQRNMATYLMGMGHEGGLRPKQWSWKWAQEKPEPSQWYDNVYQDSFWLGNVDAGLQCELRGADYCGPLVVLYWRLGQLAPPTFWHNAGQGGCTVEEVGDDRVIVKAYSGPRKLKAGQPLRFEFAFLITPVKPLDTAKHFNARYYHNYVPIDQVKEAGGNIINVHHGNEANPYINYPFLANDKLKTYVDQAHQKGVKVKIYYTVRELTNHIVELWALRSLGHEVLAPGSDVEFAGTGYPWLREHLVRDFAPSWYQHFADGNACASIVNQGASRWYNYYVEGLGWLVKNVGIDGIYLDDVSYDRDTLKRIRKVMDRNRAGCLIDLHSNTAYSYGPANQYMEFFPYVDRLWFGEGFDYDRSPDYWLTEISGIPFGMMGDMLQNGGNKWRGMLYGMTARIPWHAPRNNLWEVWDRFGIDEAKMLGYWDPSCPVRTGHDDVLATAYVRKGKTLLAVASWADVPVDCPLSIDWKALGLDPKKATLYAPAIDEYQQAAVFGPTDPIPLLPRQGWLFWVDEQPHEAPEYVPGIDRALEGRQVILEETFSGSQLGPSWTSHLTEQGDARLEVKDGALVIHSRAHHCAFAERDLPSGTTMIQCRINSGTDQGMTWGPGLGLVWPSEFLRINLRPPEGRCGVDDGRTQGLYRTGIEPNKDYYVRLRLQPEQVFAEVSHDGKVWWPLSTFSRGTYAGDPIQVRLGKMGPGGTNVDADATPNEKGSSTIAELRVYGSE
jgi:glycosyl hydrolase family 123